MLAQVSRAHRPVATRSPTDNLIGALSSMKLGTHQHRALLRQAFDPLLELRARREAPRLLTSPCHTCAPWNAR